jgi:hypothetical protein
MKEDSGRFQIPLYHANVRTHCLAQFVGRASFPFRDRAQGFQKGACTALGDFIQKVFLGIDVCVQAAGQDAACLGNVPDGGSVVPFLTEQPTGNVQNFFASSYSWHGSFLSLKNKRLFVFMVIELSKFCQG